MNIHYSVSLSKITRESVRALITCNAACMSKAAQAGQDPHRVALEQQGEISSYMARLSEPDLSTFVALYEEEMAMAVSAQAS